jgi:ubiquinone/menaquinone biosynthesis C-methylase UbiE
MTTTTRIDYEAIKTRQQATWAAGDFAIIGTTLQIVGESLCETLGLPSGSRVLDVAAGNGTATLAAARRWCDVVSTDFVPALLERGRARAEAEGLEITFRTADAEHLPFADGEFDAALSTYGVMFAPNHARAAQEMARVVRSGGRIGLANWTPTGFIGEMLRTVGKHVSPPPGLVSPVLWGTEGHLYEIFGNTVERIEATPRNYMFRYRSADHFIEVFRDYYGPVHKAFAALDEAGQEAFAGDLRELLERYDQGDDGALVVPGEYLEVSITRK